MDTALPEIRHLREQRGTIQKWERGKTEPAIRHLPGIIEFFGYDSLRERSAIPARIANGRRKLGMTQDELATILNIDAVTIWRWETGRLNPPPKALRKMQGKLGRMHLE